MGALYKGLIVDRRCSRSSALAVADLRSSAAA
jgi:hypothetical protein